MIKRVATALLGLLLILPALPALSAPASSDVTLEQIMANPDWIGNPPIRAYWGYDGRHIYYWRKRDGSPLSDLYAVNLGSNSTSKVPDSELGTISAPGGSYNLAHTLKVFIRNNNVFVRDLKTGALRQLTRDSTGKSDVSFMSDSVRVQWHQDHAIYLYDLRSGTLSLAADIRFSEDPSKSNHRRITCRPSSCGCSISSASNRQTWLPRSNNNPHRPLQTARVHPSPGIWATKSGSSAVRCRPTAAG